MSIQERKYRMPQPEQWLSEHPELLLLAIPLGLVVVLVLHFTGVAFR